MNTFAGRSRTFFAGSFIQFVLTRFVAGLLIIAPIYLAALLLLKVASTIVDLVRPLSKVFPEWMPRAEALSFLIAVIFCFGIGVAVSTSMGRSIWERIEKALFQKIPGYALFRSLTQQMAGKTQEKTWKPALAEIEEALVPAFIIEELEDGRFTVFVPSAPTPLAGAIYILTANRVHPLNVPFAEALKTVLRWGSGSRELVAAMEQSEQTELTSSSTTQ